MKSERLNFTSRATDKPVYKEQCAIRRVVAKERKNWSSCSDPDPSPSTSSTDAGKGAGVSGLPAMRARRFLMHVDRTSLWLLSKENSEVEPGQRVTRLKLELATAPQNWWTRPPVSGA